MDGNGKPWWDACLAGKLPIGCGARPVLLTVAYSSNVVIEHIELVNGPRFHLFLHQLENLEVGYCNVTVDRHYQRSLKANMQAARVKALSASYGIALQEEMVLQPEDLNTDGIDISGVNAWVHDCIISNDDDSVAIKSSKASDFVGVDSNPSTCSENIVIERMVMTGYGASVGAVAPKSALNRACVRNVTFRDIQMPHTGKGIYIKSNPGCDGSDGNSSGKTGLIEDILYENVVIDRPSWWAIWIGPQQQHEPGSPLGDLCSLAYPWSAHCPVPACVTMRSIVLRNITITNPLMSPGVVLGNKTNPILGLEFHDVRVVGKSGEAPFDGEYLCENAIGATSTGSFPSLVCSSTTTN